jgi:hypothetical protein
MSDSFVCHAWEASGVLGRAPYTVLGFQGTADRAGEQREREANGLTFTTNLCGGTCAICHQAIFNVYRIRSADGVEFKVGPDCVSKAGDGGMKRRVKSDVNANNKRRRKAREQSRVDAANLLLADPAVKVELALYKHGHSYHASKGLTRLDEAEFLLMRGGASGRLRACMMIEAAAAEAGKAVRS